MLSYAFKVLRDNGYKSMATEEFNNIAEMMAQILLRGISLRLNRGLEKEYLSQTQALSFLRGKIDENKIYQYQNEAFKDYLNLSEQLEKSIQDVVCLCLNYKFLTSYYSEWTVEPKNPI